MHRSGEFVKHTRQGADGFGTIRRLFAGERQRMSQPSHHVHSTWRVREALRFMSRSPRKLLRGAAQALNALRDVWDRYPDARREAEMILGADRVLEVERARRLVVEAADALEAEPERQARAANFETLPSPRAGDARK